jgi:hypothetical protein
MIKKANLFKRENFRDPKKKFDKKSLNKKDIKIEIKNNVEQLVNNDNVTNIEKMKEINVDKKIKKDKNDFKKPLTPELKRKLKIDFQKQKKKKF